MTDQRNEGDFVPQTSKNLLFRSLSLASVSAIFILPPACSLTDTCLVALCQSAVPLNSPGRPSIVVLVGKLAVWKNENCSAIHDLNFYKDRVIAQVCNIWYKILLHGCCRACFHVSSSYMYKLVFFHLWSTIQSSYVQTSFFPSMINHTF